MAQKLCIVPATLEEANQFVRTHHRHHGMVRGHKFSLAVVDEADAIRGVAIVGRPVARHLDNGLTLEVNRVATDGCPNACSALYGACRRAAFALGYKRLVTYTLDDEGGASLRGAGWKCIGTAGGNSWNRKSRPRVDTHPLQMKMRWEAGLAGGGKMADKMILHSSSEHEEMVTNYHLRLPGRKEYTMSGSDINWRVIHTDFVNEILKNAPSEWDDDVAAEVIAVNYVRHLESEISRLGGRLWPCAEEDAPRKSAVSAE